MITPAIIGFIPTPVTVFNPIAAKAIDKKNLDKNAVDSTTLSGTSPVLLNAHYGEEPKNKPWEYSKNINLSLGL